ncbi:beta-glucosidase [Halogranum gelatinilyticum]|uniref:Beta-glucosidase n=1 Tax=Halogranum gelatinilyticum TaxID=660521 RepID=A0A1G9YXD8_9EURY|nr:glycoside hydrolase family 3 C-terminal domain-containing protein [Halogranum gelatinilyticum]SDN13839.1 beta-glucosidase [Halogranum gelatinilyticum]
MSPDIPSLVDELTLSEKIQLLHGSVDPDGKATGYLPGVDRLDVPPLRMVDGPLGVRAMGERATAFPASVALAASWRPSLARQFGTALARETAAHGQDVILAPGVNIHRAPLGGRNFEYYSEDPHLAARITVGTIEGIESEDIAAMVKHYVANNQETNRYEVSAEVSERALREIYLPPFRAAVQEADVTSVMTAYNRVNGTHMSDHEYLLSDVLKDEWGFEGFVVSDWWGTRSTVEAARAGLDIEMPGVEPEAFAPDDVDMDVEDLPDAFPPIPDVAALFGEPLREAVESGDVDEAVIDEKVERLLRGMVSIGCFEERPEGALDTPGHRTLARDIATEGAVLLQNDGTLPLEDVESIAVLGPNADTPKLGGGGSSEVSAFVETSPVERLDARDVDVIFERGVPPITESTFFDEADEVDAGETSIDAAVDAAADADCAVVVAQDDATEFVDRDGLGLPGQQDELITAVAAAAERTVVVLRTSGPVTMPWLESVDAVLETWYPGQADGDALADLVFGDAEPGGRLPMTFGRSTDDYPTDSEATFPGVDDEVRYDEGVFVGYRYFHKHDVEPLFPFGHGLSYTSFEYGEPSLSDNGDEITVALPVRNTGTRQGKDVVQVYVNKATESAPTPVRELVAFEAVSVAAGEQETVTVTLDRSDFAFYDDQDGWTVPQGENTVFVGRSAREMHGKVEITL